MTIKPKLFIGSSSEAVEVAHDFAKALSGVAVCVVWDFAPEFEPTTSTLQSLLSACDVYDFGLFILTPDDKMLFRGEEKDSARDNVLLELGMFLGAIGANRTYAVVQADDNGNPCIKTTSDIYGTMIPRFQLDVDPATRMSSIETTVHTIKSKIQSVGVRPVDFRKSTWGFSVSQTCLYFIVPRDEISRKLAQLAGKALMIIGRKYNDEIDLSEDTKIVKSKVRTISPHLTERLRIEVKNKKMLGNIKVGDIVDICVLMVSPDFRLEKSENITLADLMNRGCVRLGYMQCDASE